MSNHKNPTYACRNCGSKNLRVAVLVMAKFWQNPKNPENFSTDVNDSDHEWDDDSRMDCEDCGYSSEAWRFDNTV
jgi:DNA-directed RNA polymerase subunit RPC12/RpoP